MLKIGAHEVHLWSTFPDQIQDPRLLSEYEHLLAPSERERLSHFHFERDRHQYLITRALVRAILSKYAPIKPAEWAFFADSFGRPSIANDMVDGVGLSFNITHTRGIILLGLRKAEAIGVDVENFESRACSMEVADRFFSTQEINFLRIAPTHERNRRFFDIWTLKESYAKARGLGLTLPFDAFSFDLSLPGRLSFNAQEELNDNPVEWHFWQLQFGQRFSAAVCARRTARSSLSLRLATVVPLHNERSSDYLLLRQSF